jgi:hypothetical protein
MRCANHSSERMLGHRGVLLLDELPEFHRPMLEALRQPLEDGFVAISRVGGMAVFPGRFVLVGTMNVPPKPPNQADQGKFLPRSSTGRALGRSRSSGIRPHGSVSLLPAFGRGLGSGLSALRADESRRHAGST